MLFVCIHQILTKSRWNKYLSTIFRTIIRHLIDNVHASDIILAGKLVYIALQVLRADLVEYAMIGVL